jgi:hypothetical protein
VTEPTGLLPVDISALANGRDIYIWGAGYGGENLAHFLEKHGIPVSGFCDKRYEEIQKSEALNKTIISPEQVIKLCKTEQAYLVISVFRAAKHLKSLCETEGLLPDLNFITFYKIKRLEAEIRIGDRPFMSFENFKNVLDKLEYECPYLFLVDLAGEIPRQNPDFERIIDFLQKKNHRFYVRARAGSDKNYLYPYEKYIELAEKLENNESDVLSPEYINNYDNKSVIEALREVRNRPCIVSRMYPVINSDLSAGLCHLYKTPIASPNYLETDIGELFKLRENHSHCMLCQKFGIHRLDFNISPLSNLAKIKI